jgi:hypothetical protein
MKNDLHMWKPPRTKTTVALGNFPYLGLRIAQDKAPIEQEIACNRHVEKKQQPGTPGGLRD